MLIGWTCVHRHITIVGNDGAPGTTFLCCDDDHTIGRLHTIDSCSRGILQDSDRFYILRVQTTDGITDQVFSILTVDVGSREWHILFQNNPVNNPYRRLVTVDGGITTDADLRRGTRLTAGHHHSHTRHTTL